MSSKEKKKINDDDGSNTGRKKKRLKKFTSNLFDDDDDDDDITENNSHDQKTITKTGSYDITSYFKPSSKNIENENSKIQKSTTTIIGNSDRIAVKNVNDYFNILQTDSKNSNTNIKEEMCSDTYDEATNKKRKVTQSDQAKLKQEYNTSNDSSTPHNFEYLPFNNQKFVLTGVFKNFSREDLQSKIKEHGGNVMSAVSTRTHYLIHGEYLEDGRMFNEGKKYLKAFDLQQQKKSSIKILNEEQFLELLPNTSKNDEEGFSPHNDLNNTSDQTTQMQEGTTTNTNNTTNTNTNNTTNTNTNNTNNNNNTLDECNNNDDKNATNQLWVDKYKPKHIKDLVGNTQNVIKLQTWLANWDDVCIKGIKREVKKTFRGVYENVNAKCALLSGPAGIGKTTTSKIVSEASGYNVIEFNASDERNKSAIERISEMATGGYSLTSTKNFKLNKTCIIMDEVDGMSSGDKGGSTAILKLIDKTKCPIICICNDRQNSKMRTLANKCYDLKFTLPQKNTVVKRLLDICNKENIMMEPNALELLWESSHGDIRQMLNALQLLSKTYKRIQFLDIKKELNHSNKNIQTLANPFEITLKLLNFNESSKLKIREIMDLFFVDYELMPYFISENYINIFNDTDNKSSNSLNKWNTYAQIATDLSLSEQVKSNMRTSMNFSLLPHFCILSCVCPVLRIKQLKSFMSGRINFPSAFGKISTINKNKRLLNELCFVLSCKLSISPKHLVTSGFLNFIYFKALTPLLKNCIDETITFMEEYNITKDMLTEHFPCLRLPTQENLYDQLDTKTKSAFTRLYNTSHTIKVDPNIIKKGFKASQKGGYADTSNVLKLNEYESDEDQTNLSDSKEDKDDDDDDDDMLVKLKVSKKGASKGKSTPRGKAATKNVKRKK